MRKVMLLLVTVAVLCLVAVYYPSYVEKPVKDGEGPLALYTSPSVPAAEYHSPLDWFRTHHMDMVNRGDLEQADCLYCHDPERSCNNCHKYVGVAGVSK